MPNLMKTINLQIQEVQQTQSTSNMKKTTSMCIVTKPSKSYDKCNIIKYPKYVQKTKIKMPEESFLETIQGRILQCNIFQEMKNRKKKKNYAMNSMPNENFQK